MFVYFQIPLRKVLDDLQEHNIETVNLPVGPEIYEMTNVRATWNKSDVDYALRDPTIKADIEMLRRKYTRKELQGMNEASLRDLLRIKDIKVTGVRSKDSAMTRRRKLIDFLLGRQK